MDDERAYAEVEAQVGRGAGNIAATDFRYSCWLTEILSDAARTMQVSLRSAWVRAEIWNTGTTVWQSPDGDRTLSMTAEGELAAHCASD